MDTSNTGSEPDPSEQILGAPEDMAEYNRLVHAMQSGVAMAIELGSKEANPKHLRVGVNVAIVECSALYGLLVSKGVITAREATDTILDAHGMEVSRHASELSRELGYDVVLG